VEGVVKFSLEFVSSPVLTPDLVGELNGWRAVFHRLRLIGQDPGRYQGLGFGNISRRAPAFGRDAFIISGTQTGGLTCLGVEHFALVTDCQPERNLAVAQGLCRPSSEALTHGQLYRLDRNIGAVIHVHSPEIWCRYDQLQIPATPSSATYGSGELASEIKRLVGGGRLGDHGCFAMAGHEDGLVSFGVDCRQAAGIMIETLAAALSEGGA